MKELIYLTIGEVVCHETDVARQLEQGKAFAECNKTVFEVAMTVAKFFDEQLAIKMDAIRDLSKIIDEYHDKTLITDNWLRQHFGEPTNGEYVFGEFTKIVVKCINPEVGLWRVRAYDSEFGRTDTDNTMSLFTIGQLRMFLAAQGINLKN